MERECSITIQLPPALDERLRRWSAATPGATSDPRGAHITVVSLELTRPETVFRRALRACCTSLSPFQVRLDRVMRDAYWGKPGLEIVMLTGDTQSDHGTEDIVHLRQVLIDTLEDVARCLVVGAANQPFVPHLTLTTGLPPAAAEQLALAAAELQVQFVVDEIALWWPDTSHPGGGRLWRPLERIALGRSGN